MVDGALVVLGGFTYGKGYGVTYFFKIQFYRYTVTPYRLHLRQNRLLHLYFIGTADTKTATS